MSGISTGSIFYKPAMMILAAENAAEKIIRASAAGIFAGSQAVKKYDISQSESDLNTFLRQTDTDISDMHKSISDQELRYRLSLDDMYKTISKSHESIAKKSEIMRKQGLGSFKKMLSESEGQLREQVDSINVSFQNKYSDVINSNNARLTLKMNSLRMNVDEYTENLAHSAQEKKEYEKQQALSVINDAGKLIDCAAKNNRLDVSIHSAQLRAARTDLEQGNYQSSMSLASAVITELYMKMLRSDADIKHKNFYRQNGIFLSGEIKEFLSQLKETQFIEDKDSEEISVVDLTQFMKEEYKGYIAKLSECENIILSEDSDIKSIKNAVFMLDELYTGITAGVAEAFAVMIYSLKRVETEKRIHSILKEKGFTLIKTSFTDGDPVKAGERKYVCPLTDEELTISVIPYEDEDCDIHTQLVLASDSQDCSEESRKQYRDEILEQLSGNDDIQSAELTCSEKTRNLNACDSQGLNIKIKNPVVYRKN